MSEFPGRRTVLEVYEDIFFLDYLEKIILVAGNYSSAIASIKTYLVALPSYRNDVELWDFILL